MEKRSIEVLKALRQNAVRAVINNGFTHKQACEVFGFSPMTMTKCIRAYKQSGKEGFAYKKRGVASGNRNLLSSEQENALIKNVTKYTPDELGLESSL